MAIIEVAIGVQHKKDYLENIKNCILYRRGKKSRIRENTHLFYRCCRGCLCHGRLFCGCLVVVDFVMIVINRCPVNVIIIIPKKERKTKIRKPYKKHAQCTRDVQAYNFSKK